MKDLIIKRIGELFQMEPPNKDTMRWQSFWYTPDYKRFGKPTNKEIGLHKLVHIGNIDMDSFRSLSDEKLISIFEDIIVRVYRQM